MVFDADRTSCLRDGGLAAAPDMIQRRHWKKKLLTAFTISAAGTPSSMRRQMKVAVSLNA